MLDARTCTFALHSRNVLFCKRTRKIRVFRKIFEVPPAKRRALDVHPRPQQNIRAVIQTVVRHAFGVCFYNFQIPCVGKHLHRRIGYGRFIAAAPLFGINGHTHAHACIRYPDKRQLSVEVAGMPAIFSADQA